LTKPVRLPSSVYVAIKTLPFGCGWEIIASSTDVLEDRVEILEILHKSETPSLKLSRRDVVIVTNRGKPVAAIEAGLSFLAPGAQAPTISWGAILAEWPRCPVPFRLKMRH
jgi:hypothetical protein